MLNKYNSIQNKRNKESKISISTRQFFSDAKPFKLNLSCVLLSFALKNHLRLSLLQKNRYTFEPLFLVERIDMVLGTKCDLTEC